MYCWPILLFKHLHLLKAEWTFCIYVLYEFGILIGKRLIQFSLITLDSTAIYIAIYLSFSLRNKHSLCVSLCVCGIVFVGDWHFTDSSESWPFRNTFKSHLFVYFGEFIHTQWMQRMCSKCWCDYCENWNVCALSLQRSMWSIVFGCLRVFENRLGFPSGLHTTIGNKYH